MLPYSVVEGLKGLKRARFSSIASTSAMAVALVLIGLFVIVTIQANSVSNWLRQRVGELELFLADVEDPVARALHARAGVVAGVSEAQYISKTEAEEIFRRECGEDAEIGELGAGDQVCRYAQDRVADVGKVPRAGPIEEDRVLDLRRVAEDAVAAGQHVAPQVGAVADHRPRAEDHGALLGAGDLFDAIMH